MQFAPSHQAAGYDGRLQRRAFGPSVSCKTAGSRGGDEDVSAFVGVPQT
jgi:hypothetical protein